MIGNERISLFAEEEFVTFFTGEENIGRVMTSS